MLTSHHYLLGSLFAASCTTAILFNGIPNGVSQGVASSQTLFPASVESVLTEDAGDTQTLDISYRGSGRVDDDAEKSEGERGRGPLAHRGSGRVRPHQTL